MMELLQGKTVDEAQHLCVLYREMLRGKSDESEFCELGDLVALQGVRRFSARIKCAMLAWEALEKALVKRRSSQSTAQ